MQTFWMDAARLSHWNFYLSWIGIALIVLGAVVSSGSILITRQIEKLTKLESDARQKKIEALELATRPKPIRERIIAQLDTINPKIMEAFKAGHRNFGGDLTIHQHTDLQRLASEPGASVFISFEETGRVRITAPGGEKHFSKLVLHDSLLSKEASIL